jgi:hypothetical protein
MSWRVQYFGSQKGGTRKDASQQDFYARMASVAYTEGTDARDAKLKKYKLKGFKIDPELSNDDIATIYNPDTKEIIFSVTGSRFTSKKHAMRDIRSDIGIFFGTDRLGKRTKEVKSVIEKAQDKYKDYEPTMAAHSLGGKVARNISKKTGIDAIVYNYGSSPGTIVADKIAKLLGRDVKSDTVHYTTNKLKNGAIDPVSIYGKMRDDSTTISVDKKKKGGITHSLEHFIKDDEPSEPKQEGSGCGCQNGKGGKGSGDHKTHVKKNKWLTHVDQVKRKNAGMKYSEVLKLASKSYSR